MMLALAFPESLVLFCFVISIMMVTWLGSPRIDFMVGTLGG